MRGLLYSQLYSVKEDFASDCGSRRSLKQPGWAFLGGLHEDKDIMSEMADFQEMSEVSSEPAKMWFNGRVWNLGSHSLTKLLHTTALRRQSAKQEKCMTLKSSGEGGGFDFGTQMCKILYKSSLFLNEKSTFINLQLRRAHVLKLREKRNEAVCRHS